MRSLIIASLLAATAVLAIAGTATADSYVVGNCQKSGACVGVCIHDADTSCWNDGDVCFGASYQVPQCLYSQK